MFMAILDSQQWKGTMATERLRFCHEFLISLKLRARAFVELLNNEIALELHVNNLDQLQKVWKLLQENRRDGKEVAELNKLVGYASVLFLPGTFFSGFFSTVFFSLEDSACWPYARQSWIRFVATVPVTFLGLVWLWWSRTKDTRERRMWEVIENSGFMSRKP
ncbi:hypothetical protein C8034_v008852 [Colletotrichum sidae]|uniref:Uncharacterized protein n=1 Tax=Colletotrichum sidae TaxID=1347389 RepID=A0A4R8TN47_9PEZI|nr:hypothetical protein C8034_v008852 [Colletotrichum sidae]